MGKENTQKIESKHINLRTRIKRLVRRTIDVNNGYLSNECCPWVRDEWFRAGTEPT